MWAAGSGIGDASPASSSRSVLAGWVALGLAVAVLGGALAMASPRFGYAYDVAEMPVLALTAALLAAGLVFCIVLPPLIRASLSADTQSLRLLTTLIVVMGLAARLLLFASEPMLEDDYQRYLWGWSRDGGR